MSEALAPLPDRQGIFQPPPPRQRIRIEAPPGPIPTQVRSETPRSDHQNYNPNWVRYDTPPHLGRGSKSNAIIIHPPPIGEHNHYTRQISRGPPLPRFQEIPSTIFHIGPIPPNFTIDQLHQAMRTLNPKVAMLDLKTGVMEVEIPFTLTWAQIGDCKSSWFNARSRTNKQGAEGD